MAKATCLCGESFEGPVVADRMVTPHVVCPKCGRGCVVGRIEGHEVHKGNSNFYGAKSWSIASGCHPSEVALFKKIMGPDHEGQIHRDGSVKFKNQAQQAAFVRRLENAKLQNQITPGCYDQGSERPENIEG